jgi:hypothetical protein
MCYRTPTSSCATFAASRPTLKNVQCCGTSLCLNGASTSGGGVRLVAGALLVSLVAIVLTS